MLGQALPWNFLHQGAIVSVLGVLTLVLILSIRARAERRATLTAGALFVLCQLGIGLAPVLAAGGETETSVYLREACILVGGLCLISLVGTFLFRVALPWVGLDLPHILYDVAVAVVAVVWVLSCLSANGVAPSSLIATSTVFTAVIGLSLQDTLGNLIAGMAIQSDRSIKLDDWIKIDDLVGRVVEIRWRSTSIETHNWETVVIPNSVLVKNKFLVLGRRKGKPRQWRRYLWFYVDYRHPPARVIEAVDVAFRSADFPRVARDPAPHCVLMDYAESTARYVLRYWLTEIAADHLTDSEMRSRLFFALKRAGIPMAIPAQSVFLTEETEKRKSRAGRRDLDRRVASLAHVDLFATLQPEERRHLAGRLVPTPFAQGDVITQQGAEADCLYIIAEGHADVLVESGAGGSRQVVGLEPGSVFGEMGLITGEPRSATVVARTRMECYRLDRVSFEETLRSRPEVAEEVSQLLAQRRVGLDAVLEHLDAEAQARRLSNTHRDLLGKIRRFFGLDAVAAPPDGR